MRRRVGMAALTLLAGATFASPAAGQTQRCQAPETNGWRSCLTTAHRTIDDGPQVKLTKARPRLVMRSDACPARITRRTVVVRARGQRLARETVRGTCKHGVTRWIVNLKLDVDLPGGTIVRSLWSGIADSGDGAPKVELDVD